MIDASKFIDSFLKCIKTCEKCAFECCAGNPEQAACMQACITCADFCSLCIRLGARGEVEALKKLCVICAELCDSCADECKKYDMELCRVCEAACRECAQACRSYGK